MAAAGAVGGVVSALLSEDRGIALPTTVPIDGLTRCFSAATRTVLRHRTIDWVRMDIGRPIRRSELTTLYPAYLRLIRPTTEPETDLSGPLKWAQKPVSSRIALLQPVPDAGDGDSSYFGLAGYGATHGAGAAS